MPAALAAQTAVARGPAAPAPPVQAPAQAANSALAAPVQMAPSAVTAPALAEKCVRQMWEGRVPEAYATFDEDMRKAISAEKLEEALKSERADHGSIRTVSDVSVKEKGEFTAVNLLVGFEKGQAQRFTIHLRKDGRIAGLNWVPAATNVTEKDIRDAIAAIPGRVAVSALVAEKPETAYQYQATLPLSVGSQFKVLILARAAELVTQRKLKLDDRLEISARSRSFPSGVLQDFDPGLRPTVNDLLTHMISISDNTATDTLLLALGRDAIVSRLAPWGFTSQPALLTTAEMFGLAMGLGGLPADPAQRRSALKSLDRTALYSAGTKALDDLERDRPTADSKIGEYYERVSYSDRKSLSHVLDWQISAADLADFYRRVATDRFETPETSGLVAKYLHKGGAGIIGSYLASDPRVKSIARKGGSDDGILTDGGFVTTKDGRHVVIVVMANDLPPEAGDKVVIPKLASLSQLLFNYLEAGPKR